MNEIPASRIEIHGKGVGEVSDADIYQRALEIAQMDGRSEATSADRIRAKDELFTTGIPEAPEVDRATAEIQEWDESPDSLGHMTPRVLPEDEVSATELLIEEGLEEAERDQRLSAPRESED
ncbi:hypothetical protein BH09VER1_BH09VER1_20220 [soil metagenome]